MAGNKVSHVAIIPDGCRRWAREHATSYRESYELGMRNLADIADFLFGEGISTVSVYASSVYNFRRPLEEVAAFQGAEHDFLEGPAIELARRNGASIRIIGDYEGMPLARPGFRERVEGATRSNSGRTLNMMMNYSSLAEIRAAVSGGGLEGLDELFASQPVDMLVRTGKAQVLSDYMLSQLAFARLFFPDVLFNDLTVADVARMLESYRSFELKRGE